MRMSTTLEHLVLLGGTVWVCLGGMNFLEEVSDGNRKAITGIKLWVYIIFFYVQLILFRLHVCI